MGWWGSRPDVSLAGVVLLGASVPATLLATVTGQAAYDAAVQAGAEPGVLASHVDQGELLPWVMLVLLVFRLVGPKRWGGRAHAAALVLGLAASVLVVSVVRSG